jgi:eukaryotic-like serine/threonine-protein kinase
MSADRHRRKSEIFLRAAQLDAAERRQYLADACGEDAALRDEIARMLELDARSPSFLSRPALGAGFHLEATREEGAPPHDAIPAPLPELTIGRYRVLGVLGEGGMGVVYRAEQLNPRRTVALKVLRHGSRDPDAAKRFELEAQVLARLRHPGVAHIYEAGSYHDPILGERSFLAMEHVEGVPLLRYVAENARSTAQKLELALQICDAVEHAHQRGVIHRDIKPANVLVERSGRVKVLDFGIARVIGEDWRATLATGSGQLLGTLAYMSPEQFENDSAGVDTRADVYAIGVVLHEMLSGAPPFDLHGKSLAQAIEHLRVGKPRPIGDADRHLRGDLSHIVAKAMERDKERRYASVADLAADLRRFLAGEPINARPQTTVYQLRMFARRHRELVGAIAAVFLVLLLALVGLTKYALDLDRLRAEAVAARDEARMRSDELEQVANFQSTMLSGVEAQLMGLRLREDLLGEFAAAADRRPADGAPPVIGPTDFERSLAGISFTDLAVRSLYRNVFVRALEAADREFADQPLVRARLLQSIADTLLAIGLDQEALAPQKEAMAIRRAVLGPTHPDTLASIHGMGFVLGGRSAEAEAYYLEALEGRLRVLGEDHPDTLRSLARMANMRGQQGRPSEALEFGARALAGFRRVLGEDHPETLLALHVQVPPAYALGKVELAEAYNRQVLDGRRRLLGEDHPDTLVSLNNMGVILGTPGRLEESLEFSQSALEGRMRVLGREHSQTLQSMNNVAKALEGLGRLDEAEPLLRESLETLLRLRGENNPAVLLPMTNLGNLLLSLERFDEAEGWLLRALEGRRRLLGEEHIETLGAGGAVLRLYRLTNRLDDAERLGEELLGTIERAQPGAHWQSGAVLEEYAQTLAAIGKFSEAERLMINAHDLASTALGEEHQRAREVVKRLLALYEQWAAAEPREDLVARGTSWREKLHPPGSATD